MLETAIIFALLSLPLFIPALFALASTKPKPGRSTLLFFYNPASAIGFALVAAFLFLVLLTFGLYQFYDCRYGLFLPAECGSQDNSVGDMLFKTHFFGTIYLAWMGIPSVIMYIIAEILTRFRQKKATKNA